MTHISQQNTDHAPQNVHMIDRLIQYIHRSGYLRGIHDTCKAMDELVFDDPGAAVDILGPWLRANGIADDEVTR